MPQRDPKLPCRLQRRFENPKIAISIITVIAIIPRLILTLTQSVLIWPDSVGYYWAALFMLKHHTLVSRDIFHSPLYPMFLAAFLSFGKTPSIGLAIIITQHILGLLTVIIVYFTARRVFNPLVAFYSAIVLSLHGVLLCYECVAQSEVLFMFLLSIVVLLSVRALNADSLLGYALAGFYCGLTALTRPVAQQYLLCILLVAALRLKNFRRFIGVAVIVVGSYLVITSPWMYLNSRKFGFWGLSHGEGLNLTLRVFDLDKIRPRKHTKYPEMKALYNHLMIGHHKICYRFREKLTKNLHYTPLEADHAMFAFALEALLRHPLPYLRYSFIDFLIFYVSARDSVTICPPRVGSFGCVHERRIPAVFSLPKPEAFASWNDFLNSAFNSGSLINPWSVFCALLGIAFYFKNKKTPRGFDSSYISGLMLLMTALYFGAVTAAFDTPHDRFRLPIDPILIMFALYGIQQGGWLVFSWLRRRMPWHERA